MKALEDLKFNATRRHFLSAASLGIGSVALGALLDPARLFGGPAQGACRAGAWRHADRADLPGYARGPARQAGDLSVPERRPVTTRPVRRKAAAADDERRGPAGVHPHGPAPDRHDGAPEAVPAGRVALLDGAPRPERRDGQRTAAAHRLDRRQVVLRQVDAHRGDQSRPRRDVRADGIAAGRPSLDRVVAVVRTRVGQQPTCLRSSCCCRGPARATSRSTRGSGAAASCPRSTRACSSAAARTRCSTSATPTA